MKFGDPKQSFARFGLNMRLTKAVKWLLIINGVVFLLELIIGRTDGGMLFLMDHLAISLNGFLFHGELWQPITYMFLHDPHGLSHILWNMLMLWMFGCPLEGFWGAKRFVKFYLITGVLAAGAILMAGLFWAPPNREVYTLGASGALYALLVAFGFNFPNSMIYLFGLFPIKGKHLVMLFIGLGILQNLTIGASPHTSVSAHMGGMLAGFLLVTGTWRPSRLWGYFKIWIMKRRYKKLKKKLRVVDPKDGPGGGYLN